MFFKKSFAAAGCLVVLLSLLPSTVSAQDFEEQRPRTGFSGLFALDLVNKRSAGLTAGVFYGVFGLATELVHPYAHPDMIHPEVGLFLATEVPISSVLLSVRMGFFVETNNQILGARMVGECLWQGPVGPYAMVGASIEPQGWSEGNEGHMPLFGRVGLSTRFARDVYLILFGGLNTTDRFEQLDGSGGLALHWLLHGHSHAHH